MCRIERRRWTILGITLVGLSSSACDDTSITASGKEPPVDDAQDDCSNEGGRRRAPTFFTWRPVRTYRAHDVERFARAIQRRAFGLTFADGCPLRVVDGRMRLACGAEPEVRSILPAHELAAAPSCRAPGPCAFQQWGGEDCCRAAERERDLMMLDLHHLSVFAPQGAVCENCSAFDVTGDVARTRLYMYCVWGVGLGADGAIQSALLDSTRDPPDHRERLRSELIHQTQRNGNPFVDHPKFARELACRCREDVLR